MCYDTILSKTKRLSQNRKIVCIYDDEYDDSFYCGSIISFDDTFILVDMISPDGNPDGLIVLSIDNICKIIERSSYLSRIKKLKAVDDRKLPLSADEVKMDGVIETILAIAIQNDAMVAISLCESGYNNIQGFVQSFDDKICVVRQFDLVGEYDGIAYVLIEKITQITCGSRTEDEVMTLFRIGEE